MYVRTLAMYVSMLIHMYCTGLLKMKAMSLEVVSSKTAITQVTIHRLNVK